MAENGEINTDSLLDKPLTRRDFLKLISGGTKLLAAGFLAMFGWAAWNSDSEAEDVELLMKNIRNASVNLRKFAPGSKGAHVVEFNQLQDQFKKLVEDFYNVSAHAKKSRDGKKRFSSALPELLERSKVLVKKTYDLQSKKGLDT